MPLVVMCGIPASGKTTVAFALKAYVESHFPGTGVFLINEEAYSIDKNSAHKDSKSEKDLRAFFRSNVDKVLSGKSLVVLDYQNYIKGFRYELFCLARTVKSTYCVVYCESTLQEALRNNKGQQGGFNEALLKDLASRMERPEEKNRWDSPLFHAWRDEPLDFAEVCKVLFTDKKKSKDPVSTKTELKLGENYSYELDKSVQEAINEILKHLNQNQMTFGNKFVKCLVANTELTLKSNVTMNDLKKAKIDFMNANKLNPFKDPKSAKVGFLYFLKSRIEN